MLQNNLVILNTSAFKCGLNELSQKQLGFWPTFGAKEVNLDEFLLMIYWFLF